MNKDNYLDKKIPEGAGEPEWFHHPSDYMRDTEEMHRLDAEWQEVYKKTREYLRILTGEKQ